MCGDTLIASLLAATWPDRSPAEDVEEEASWLRNIVTDACDASMSPGRRAAYWWSGEIAELRRSSVRARRRFVRSRRSGIAARIDNAYGEYRTARYSLRQEISRAKDGAWGRSPPEYKQGPVGAPLQVCYGQASPLGAPDYGVPTSAGQKNGVHRPERWNTRKAVDTRGSPGVRAGPLVVEPRVRQSTAGCLAPGLPPSVLRGRHTGGGQGPWMGGSDTANWAVACVVRAIRALGLEVSPHKSEAVFFHDGLRGAPPPAQIMVGNVPVPVGPSIKYLGLTLDRRWSFENHFVELAPRLERLAAATSRLMPNLGGPNEKARRLYAGAIRSVALYGAPMWADDLAVTSRVGGDGSGRHPPIALLAPAYADAYERVRQARERGARLTARAKEVLGRQARQQSLLAWQRQLSDPTIPSGRRAAEAVHPCLAEWLDRDRGGVTFRMAQVLSGRGCFGEYLSRIGRERGPRCHHCSADQDTAQHTLEAYPAWAERRRVLVNEIGGDLSLPTIVREIVGSERSWKAFSSFCEEVISQKEEAERMRQAADPVLRRGGRGAGGVGRRRRPPS
ncbi:uncharacterized protein LOC105287771 [Ooceraea biroi]|uniref:uncharacterized protein LOC105287771 n=1 Tax=Ooceraea biroi TaxID=2015173 RepID=UPI000F0846AE|nr:uncharacterized protein LOC105287771 [Ooceraea biroi]